MVCGPGNDPVLKWVNVGDNRLIGVLPEWRCCLIQQQMPVRHPEDLLLSVQRGPQEPGCGGVGLAASGGQYDEGTVRWGFFLHPVQAHHRLILMLVWVLHIEAFLWGYFPGCQHSGRFRSHHQIPPSHSVVSCSISFFAVPGNMNHPRSSFRMERTYSESPQKVFLWKPSAGTFSFYPKLLFV